MWNRRRDDTIKLSLFFFLPWILVFSWDWGCEIVPMELKSSSDLKITFSTPIKSTLRGSDFLIIKIAIHSWLSPSSNSKLLLFVDDMNISVISLIKTEIIKYYGSNRVKICCYTTFMCGKKPLLSEWITKSIKECETRYLTLINSDIILSKIWYPELSKYFGAFKYPTMYIASRHDLRVRNFTGFAGSRNNDIATIYNDMMSNINKTSSLRVKFNTHGLDIFTFDVNKIPLPTGDLPSFCLGCPKWDDLMTFYGNHYGILVCYAEVIPIYHIQLESHEKWGKDKKCRRNLVLGRKVPNGYLREHLCVSTDYIINETGLTREQIQNRYGNIKHTRLKPEEYFKPVSEKEKKSNERYIKRLKNDGNEDFRILEERLENVTIFN